MPEPVSLRVAAAALGVNECTVRRWVQQGAPCVRAGAPGRNCGALVDLAAMRRWRAERAGAEIAVPGDSVIRETIARGLLAAFKRGNGGKTDPMWRQLGVNSSRAALIISE